MLTVANTSYAQSDLLVLKSGNFGFLPETAQVTLAGETAATPYNNNILKWPEIASAKIRLARTGVLKESVAAEAFGKTQIQLEAGTKVFAAGPFDHQQAGTTTWCAPFDRKTPTSGPEKTTRSVCMIPRAENQAVYMFTGGGNPYFVTMLPITNNDGGPVPVVEEQSLEVGGNQIFSLRVAALYHGTINGVRRAKDVMLAGFAAPETDPARLSSAYYIVAPVDDENNAYVAFGTIVLRIKAHPTKDIISVEKAMGIPGVALGPLKGAPKN